MGAAASPAAQRTGTAAEFGAAGASSSSGSHGPTASLGHVAADFPISDRARGIADSTGCIRSAAGRQSTATGSSGSIRPRRASSFADCFRGGRTGAASAPAKAAASRFASSATSAHCRFGGRRISAPGGLSGGAAADIGFHRRSKRSSPGRCLPRRCTRGPSLTGAWHAAACCARGASRCRRIAGRCGQRGSACGEPSSTGYRWRGLTHRISTRGASQGEHGSEQRTETAVTSEGTGPWPGPKLPLSAGGPNLSFGIGSKAVSGPLS